MQEHSNINSANGRFLTQAGHDPARDKAGCRAILEYFRSLPSNLTDRQCPSSLELIRDGRFGQRPVNRINDLVLGKFDGHRYDFERIRCGRGEYRWRLHEPTRPGYPKHKQQTVLNLSGDWYERQTGRKRPGWQSRPFSEKRMAQDDCFVLTPPEPRQ